MSELHDHSLHDHGLMAHRRGGRLKHLAKRLREAQVSGVTLLVASAALTVLAAAAMLWSGILHGAPRIIFLLVAALVLWLRRLSALLGAVTPADGMTAPPPPTIARRLGELWEEAVILAAAGFAAYGSGSALGPAVGVFAAVLVLASAWRLRGPRALPRPDPTLLLAAVCVIAVFAPLWGWRGQTLVIGLCLIAVILAVRLIWPGRAHAR